MTASPSIVRLQKQMVCLRPDADDLARRTPIALTERDRDLLTDVHTHGFLTAELVELAQFPDDDHHRRSRSSCCYDRLKALWLWNYLERVELPVARVLGGRRPYLYALGRRGVPHVQARLGPERPPVQLRRLDRLNDLFVEHDLRAAALWASLAAVVRTSRIRRLAWTPERELRASKLRVRDPDTRRWLTLLPDAMVELVYPSKRSQVALLEVDMGTVDLWRFARTVRTVEAFAREGLFGEHFDLAPPEVWVLAPSAERAETLRRATWPEVWEDRHEAYVFGTFDQATPARLAGRNWLYLDGHRRALFDREAFAVPTPTPQT